MKRFLATFLILSIAYGDVLYLVNGRVIDGIMIKVNYRKKQIHFSDKKDIWSKYIYDFSEVKYVTDAMGKILWDPNENFYLIKNRKQKELWTCCGFVVLVGLLIVIHVANSDIIWNIPPPPVPGM
jgi:hypothetical protein